MENKEYFKGLNYEGYYDENGDFNINISKEVAEEVLQRLTGAKVIIND
jgi:hypothetical protein